MNIFDQEMALAKESGENAKFKNFNLSGIYVIPAKAGIQSYLFYWIPAFAGMTEA